MIYKKKLLFVQLTYFKSFEKKKENVHQNLNELDHIL